MHAYLIVLEITPLQIGAKYDMLPLHCTLAHWFWVDASPEVLAERLAESLVNVEPIVLEARGEQIFTGKTKHGTVSVTVNDIVLTPQLRKLHGKICDILDGMDARYSEPQYMRDGYHPHVTHQKNEQLEPGETHLSTTLYLIDAYAPEYGNSRTVRAAISLRL